MTSSPDRPLADALVAEFKSNPDMAFSGREAEALAAAADRDIWAAKAAALHCFRQGHVAEALAFARTSRRASPIPKASRMSRSRCGSWGGTRKPQPGSRRASSCSTDRISRPALRAAREARQGRRGGRGWRPGACLKDASALPRELLHPIVRAFDVERRSRNVIAFSIWGTELRYLKGALTNAIVARYLYPGWTARFYTDRSTPAASSTS